MGVTKEEVEHLLNTKLSPAHLEVINTSGGCGASFKIEIVSARFEGIRLLERHRMVNDALKEKMTEIHAVSITKAVAPEKRQQLEAEKKPEAAT